MTNGCLTAAAHTRVIDRIVRSTSTLSAISARQQIDEATTQQARDIVVELENSAREIHNVAFASRVPEHRADDISQGAGK